MSLSYTMKQVYTRPSYQNRANMHIYVSEDFRGLCTAEGIEEAQPRFDIEPLTLTKMVEGQEIKMTNPEKEFGFTYVFPKGKPAGNYNPSATRLLFQPSADNTGLPAEIWAISQQLDPSAVSPDEGTPIKSLDTTAPSYTYKYMAPGEYVVTFVARNANMWNMEIVVREMKITVKER